MRMRVNWDVVFYVLSLACLAVVTWKYGLMAALLAYVACSFMGASMAVVVSEEEDENVDADE